MIYSAIRLLAYELNQFLRGALSLAEDIVVVSNLVGTDGAQSPNVSNKVVLMLTSIERDTAGVRAQDAGMRAFSAGPPVFLNFYLMVAANFSGNHYPDALKLIGAVIGFFQKQASFDPHNSPDLDETIEKLVLDIENLSPQQLSNIWGLLGGRYMPSVLYRVRMIAVDGESIRSRKPLVSEPLITAEPHAGVLR